MVWGGKKSQNCLFLWNVPKVPQMVRKRVFMMFYGILGVVWRPGSWLKGGVGVGEGA